PTLDVFRKNWLLKPSSLLSRSIEGAGTRTGSLRLRNLKCPYAWSTADSFSRISANRPTALVLLIELPGSRVSRPACSTARFHFLPLTTLAYAWMVNSGLPIQGLNLLILIVAVVIDVGGLGGGEYHRRRR